jgi:DNA-binding response OmpR family regulator
MDPDKQVLLRDGQLIALTPKAFETLLVLVRRGREVVSKEELLKETWPDSFVGPTRDRTDAGQTGRTPIGSRLLVVLVMACL